MCQIKWDYWRVFALCPDFILFPWPTFELSQINVVRTKSSEDSEITVANNSCKEREDQASMCNIKRILHETTFTRNYSKSQLKN